MSKHSFNITEEQFNLLSPDEQAELAGRAIISIAISTLSCAVYVAWVILVIRRERKQRQEEQAVRDRVMESIRTNTWTRV